MSDLELFTYQDRQLRTLLIDGEPWFVLADLCAALEIANRANVAARLDRDCVRQADILDARGLLRPTTVVNEAAMYDVVIRSDKAEATKFRRWVTGEVLPTIRKTGGYELNEDQIVQRAMHILDNKVRELEAKVAEDAPKVNYHDTYVSSGDLLKLRVVAANNHVSEQWLRELLIERGWVYAEVERRYSQRRQAMEIRRRYSAYAHKQQYFKPVEVHDAPLFKGEVMHTLKVTPAGAEAIARLVAKEVAA